MDLHGNVMNKAVAVFGVLMLSGLMACASGCAALGYAASVIPPRPMAASYAGLKGESVAIMVWVDRGTRIDNPTLRLDIANGVHQRLIAAQKDKKKELELTAFPVEPRSIVRYQTEHPEVEIKPILDVAPIINVSRVIYVELTEFQTRPDGSLDLYRGLMAASVKVVEVDESGKSKLAYENDNVRVVFPKKSPPEGIPASNDIKIYQGTLDEFTKVVAELFYTHDVEE